MAENIRFGFANQVGKATQLRLNARLCAESKLPSNLTEGCQIEAFGVGTNSQREAQPGGVFRVDERY